MIKQKLTLKKKDGVYDIFLMWTFIELLPGPPYKGVAE